MRWIHRTFPLASFVLAGLAACDAVSPMPADSGADVAAPDGGDGAGADGDATADGVLDGASDGTESTDSDAADDDALGPDADAATHDGPAEVAGDPDSDAAVTDSDADGLGDATVPDGDDGGPDTTGALCTTVADCKASGDCVQVACTAGTCAEAAMPNGAACTGGDACVLTGICVTGQCQAIATVTCDDGNPCTDDGCDGATGACGHKPVADGTPCVSGSACTAGETCSSGACTGGTYLCGGCQSSADCAAYDDGDACNGTLFCDTATTPGTCKTAPASTACVGETGNPCTALACNPSNGTCYDKALAAATPCEDGDPCTAGGMCDGTSCKSPINICPCQGDADCADDGNPCNGKLYCDKAASPQTCKVNPATVPSCPADDNPCTVEVCDPAKAGVCTSQPLGDGAPCNDGKPLTVGDSCGKGTCQGTDVSGCKVDADCAAQEDGNFCNGVLFCNKAKGACELNEGTKKTCPSVANSACATNNCVATTGLCAMQPAPDTTPCDDGSACTGGDACQGGLCKGSAFVCECVTNQDCAVKDANLCVGTHYCDKGKCVVNPAKKVLCAQDGQNSALCTVMACDPKTGICAAASVADMAPCDDGNACTQGDACSAGVCTGTSTCACQQDADCKDDGDLCNGTPYCDKSDPNAPACKTNPVTVKQCASVDDTACSKAACVPKTGVCKPMAVNEFGLCDADGNPCTKFDTCVGGACKSGANICGCQVDADCASKATENKCFPVWQCVKPGFTCQPVLAQGKTCDPSGDGPCVATSCDPKDGACTPKVKPPGSFCSDNSACKGPQLCQGSACVAGTPVSCDDANGCTKDACDDQSGGCTHVALDAGPCDDATACTKNDGCAKGQCVGTAVDCNDSDVCTVDECDPKTACVHLPAAPTACSDSDACTLGDGCAGGTCMPGKDNADCDDLQACTVDSCDKALGCQHKGETGKACDDGSACTEGDACSAGICTGSPVNCDDSEPCTKDACDKKAGCTYAKNIGAACDDGSACTIGDSCNGLGFCAPGKTQKNCDDANLCTADSCNPAAGCVHAPTAGACDDGSACTKDDACSAAACKGVALVCKDDNVCTDDSCDLKTGCVMLPKSASPCDDNNACTEQDACDKGTCAGAAKDCDDKNPCTEDSCDKTASCGHKNRNGEPCSDGSACTEDDVCAQLVCTGKPRLWSTTLALSQNLDDRINDVALTADGGVIAVGAAIVPNVIGTYTVGARARLDRYGKETWKLVNPTVTPHDGEAMTVVALPSGDFIVGSWYSAYGSSTKRDVDVSLYDAAGNWKGGQQPKISYDQTVADSAIASDGSVGMCGNQSEPSALRGLIVRLSASVGTPTVKNMNPPAGTGAFGAAAAGSSASLWCGGNANGGQLWLARFDTQVNYYSTKLIPLAEGKSGSIQSIQPVTNGVLLGGFAATSGVAAPLLMLLSSSTQGVIWQQTMPRPHVVVIATAELGGGTYGVAMRTMGAELWSVGVRSADGVFGEVGKVEALGARTGNSAAWHKDFGWTFGGAAGAGIASNFHVWRADAAGNQACADSGDCLIKAVGGCDDGKACTIDACTANGCAHLSAIDGVTCASSKACKAGVCESL